MHRARKLVAGIVSAASMIVGVVGFAPAVAHGATCNGLFTIDYVGAPNFALPGDTVRVRLTLGTGSIQGGTELSVNRLTYRYVASDACSLAEQCVGGTGWRRLLQFNASELQGFFADLRHRGWIA